MLYLKCLGGHLLLFEILLSIMDDDIKSKIETGELDAVGNKDFIESSA